MKEETNWEKLNTLSCSESEFDFKHSEFTISALCLYTKEEAVLSGD